MPVTKPLHPRQRSSFLDESNYQDWIINRIGHSISMAAATLLGKRSGDRTQEDSIEHAQTRFVSLRACEELYEHAQKLETHVKILDSEFPALIVSSDYVLTEKVAHFFDQYYIDVHEFSSLEIALDILMSQPTKWSLAAIDIDSFDNIYKLTSILIDFRLDHPRIPILLISKSFSRDDLSQERLPVCDASIQTPSGSASIFKGACAAVENNRVWRKRLSDLGVDYRV